LEFVPINSLPLLPELVVLLALAVLVPVLVVERVLVDGTDEELLPDVEPDTTPELVGGKVVEPPLHGCRPDWM